MDLSQPYRAVSPTIAGAVLVALARTTAPLTGRQVAALSPTGSQKGIQNALDQLVAQGLVARQGAGRAFLYMLNREHVAAPAVTVLADLRSAMIDRVRDAIAAWSLSPLHASMFGSAARGEGDTESDIDLFLIRRIDLEEDDPKWMAQLDELARSVESWTGNHANINEVSPARLERLRTEKAPILDSLRRDAITLYGSEFRHLIDLAPLSLELE